MERMAKAEIIARADKIDGWFRYEELGALYELAKRYIRKGDLVVEVGSWKGRSSFILAKVCQHKRAKLLCIDTFTGSNTKDENYKEAEAMGAEQFIKENIRKNLTGLSVRYVIQNSLTAHSLLKNETIKFLFIDGDHTNPVIKQDLDNFWPKVRRDGCFAGHDYDPSCPDVIQEVNNKFGGEIKDRILGSIWFNVKK